MSSLIIDYLAGSDILELIQAISLWGSKDEKMHYLFVDKKVTMFKFVKKLGCDSILRSKEKKISDHRRSYYFKRSHPSLLISDISSSICMFQNVLLA